MNLFAHNVPTYRDRCLSEQYKKCVLQVTPHVAAQHWGAEFAVHYCLVYFVLTLMTYLIVFVTVTYAKSDL